MAKDEYIRNLMSNFRPAIAPETSTIKQKKEFVDEVEVKLPDVCGDINSVLEEIRKLKIKGDKKRLIKIDDKNEDILKVLYPVFSVDVTRFVNFLLTRFFEEHPHLIDEIKKSFKEL